MVGQHLRHGYGFIACDEVHRPAVGRLKDFVWRIVVSKLMITLGMVTMGTMSMTATATRTRTQNKKNQATPNKANQAQQQRFAWPLSLKDIWP